jgi:hypothetical protein
MALTVVVVPMFAPYNQVLLAPAIMALCWSESSDASVLPAIRLARGVGAILLVWPWIAALALSGAYPWLTPELRERVYVLPFYAKPFYPSFMLPVFVFGLALLDTWMSRASTTQSSTTQSPTTQTPTTQARPLRERAPAE